MGVNCHLAEGAARDMAVQALSGAVEGPQLAIRGGAAVADVRAG